MRFETKVTPAQVETFLRENGVVKVREIADEFKCSRTVVKAKLARLRRDGTPIVSTQNGVEIMRRVRTEKDAQAVRAFYDHLFKMMIAAARSGVTTKALAIEARKKLAVRLSKTELAQMTSNLALLALTFQSAEIEST